MTLDQQLGEKLSQARLAAGLELVEAAPRIGLTAFKLKQFEAGAIRIPSDILHRAARLFDVEIRWFFEGSVEGATVAEAETSAAQGRAQILGSLRNNKTLSRLCEAVRESDYRVKSQKFVA